MPGPLECGYDCRVGPGRCPDCCGMQFLLDDAQEPGPCIRKQVSWCGVSDIEVSSIRFLDDVYATNEVRVEILLSGKSHNLRPMVGDDGWVVGAPSPEYNGPQDIIVLSRRALPAIIVRTILPGPAEYSYTYVLVVGMILAHPTHPFRGHAPTRPECPRSGTGNWALPGPEMPLSLGWQPVYPRTPGTGRRLLRTQ